MHTETDRCTIRSPCTGHCSSSAHHTASQTTDNHNKHPNQALPFCRQSCWGSPPLDPSCRPHPGLWSPLPFSLRPVRRTEDEESSAGHRKQSSSISLKIKDSTLPKTGAIGRFYLNKQIKSANRARKMFLPRIILKKKQF